MLFLEAVEVLLTISPCPTLILSALLPPSVVMWFGRHLRRA